MMILSLSVLVIAISLVQTRRLTTDDLDNTIGSSSDNLFNTGNGWVNIISPPKPVISKLVGSYVELECEAMGWPAPTMQWLKGKTPLTENESFETNMIAESPSQGIARVKTRLVINFLLPIHNGRFTCLAEGQSQIATADVDLYVIKKDGYERNFTQLITSKILGAHHMPRITLWAPAYIEVMGSNVVLPCQTVGNPKPTLMWIDPKGNIIRENDGRVSVLPDGELSIRSINWEDMGVYNCLVRNSVGQDSVDSFLYPMKPSK